MSNALATNYFLDQLAADVLAAWSVQKVYFGRPFESTQRANLPIASISLQNVTQDFDTAKEVEQSYEFTISGRFAMPSNQSARIDQEKSDRADELIARLQSGAGYTDYGYLPIVTLIDFMADEDFAEGYYHVGIVFSVKARADHH